MKYDRLELDRLRKQASYQIEQWVISRGTARRVQGG